jgi:xylulose-5-phosphate/fructose-6-phosphate phosphoketolase
LRERMRNEIIDNLAYAHEQGMDKLEVVNWRWLF